jgi:hypothetical protein
MQDQTMSRTRPTPITAAHRLIDRLLAAMLDSVPGASRVCLNGFGEENGLTAVRRRRHKSAKTVSCKHRLAGLPPPDRSLTDEEMFLPASRAGYCSLLNASDLPAAPARDCLRSPGASSVLVCPAAGLAEKPAGAVLIVWDCNGPPPEEAELIAPMALGVRVGGQIAAVLELCHHASTLLPSTSAEVNRPVCAFAGRDTAGRVKAGEQGLAILRVMPNHRKIRARAVSIPQQTSSNRARSSEVAANSDVNRPLNRRN